MLCGLTSKILLDVFKLPLTNINLKQYLTKRRIHKLVFIFFRRSSDANIEEGDDPAERRRKKKM